MVTIVCLMAQGTPEGPSWPSEPATVALRRAHLAAGDADLAVARALGLRSLDMAAMIHITSGEPLGPKELSARLDITPGAATELTDRLERAGHVVREADPVDRRRVRLIASPQSRSRILRELGGLVRGLDETLERFTPGERATIARYLEAATESLRAFAEGHGDGQDEADAPTS
jgi:DNA-binding MarR family transcriptional regulator